MSLRDKKYDAVIVGAGLAGMHQLLRLTAAGRRVAIIYDTFGATQHFSGAFDVVDPRWQDAGLAPSSYPKLEDALRSYVRAHPNHLYARLAARDGVDAFAKTVVSEADRFFAQLSYPILDNRHFSVGITPTGRLRPCSYISITQGLLPTECNSDTSVVYVDFKALQQEYPRAVIESELRAVFPKLSVITVEDLQINKTSPLWSLNHRMESSPEVRSTLTQQLLSQIGSARLVILPPVFGTIGWVENWRQMQTDLGVRVVELLSTVPSISGQRLAKHFESVFQKSNATVHQATVISSEIRGTDDVLLRFRQRDGSLKDLAAAKVILATGKYLGGGIERERVFREPLFNAKLALDGVAFDANTAMTETISARAVDSQPFLRVGVMTNSVGAITAGGVKGADMTPVYACGHVLDGFDFTRDRCGFGASIASSSYLTY